MKGILFLGVLLSFTIASLAQQVTVLEKGSMLPISEIVIHNANKDKTVITDIEGKASLDEFELNEKIYFKSILYNNLVLKKSVIAKNNYIVYLEANVEDLDEIVISQSKFPQNKRDVPQKIININARDIELNMPQTSADLLEGTGNVYIQKSQLGGGSPMIRGFSTNRLLITVDGVRMNNAIFRGGNVQNIISIDPFSIQNTEISLGAGSIVYGSDAIGGVMSFYTKKPKLSYSDSLYFKANAIARYATANEEKAAHADFNFGLKKWGFLTSVSYTNFDDLRMGKHGPKDYLRSEFVQTINGLDTVVQNSNPLLQTPTTYDQINLLQKVKYEASDNLSFDMGLYYSATSDYSRYDRLLRYRNNTLRSAEWYYGPQRWFMGNFQLTNLSSRSNLYNKIKTTLAYQNFQESRIDRDFQSSIRNIRKEAVDAFSANLDLEKQFTPKSSLFYGLEYVYNKIKSNAIQENINTNTSIASVTRYPNGSNWQSIAAYMSIKYKPNPKFVFQSGMRYNHVFTKANFEENNRFLNLPFSEAKINSGAFTATAGISWIPNKTIEWKLNASTAFRAPNIDDIGKVFDSEPGSVVVPNENLKHEYAYGGELGLKLNFEDIFIIDLSSYYTFLNDALVRRDYNLNGENQIVYNNELSNVQAIQNASKAWIYGFEAGIKVNLSKSLKLTSQYNIIGGSEEDLNGIEVPIRHVAPSFGNTHLIWKHKKFLINAFTVYNGELSFNQLAPSETQKDYLYASDANGNPYSPSWYTFNLRTQYQVFDNLSLIASLENITDQRYKTYSSGIASAGRNLIVSLKYSL